MPEKVVIRAIEDAINPVSEMGSSEQQSRFVCLPCTREVRALVICDSPVCRRCTRYATIQRTLAAGEPIPTQSPDETRFTNLLARHAAAGRFTLPKRNSPNAQRSES